MRRPGIDLRLASQVAVVTAVSATTIGAAGRLHQWNSDDVALQVAMRTWSPGNSTLYMPEGTWFLRVPLQAIVEAVFGSGTSTLLVEAIAVNVLAALMIFWFIRLVTSKVVAHTASPSISAENGWMAVLVTCWMLTLSSVVVDSMLRPNLRNLEIGVVCVGLGLVVGRVRLSNAESAQRSIRRLALPALWFGVLAIDDPTAMYSIVIPAALIGALVFATRRSPLAEDVVLVAGGSVVTWRVGLLLLRAVGVETVSLNPRVIHAAELPTTLANTTDSLARVFDVPIFGATLHDLRLAVVLPQLALLSLAAIAVVRHRTSIRSVPLVIGSAAWAVGLLAAFLLSSHGLSEANIRYVVFGAVPIVAILAASLAATDGRPRRVMLGLMVVVLSVHLYDVARSMRTDTSPNSDAARLVEALSKADVRRGYGDFWETVGPSYFDESLTLVPVRCVDAGLTAARHWFVDGSIAKPDPMAERTAYINNDRPGLLTCTLEQVKAQFGEPLETIQVTTTITLLLYEGDIANNFALPARPG